MDDVATSSQNPSAHSNRKGLHNSKEKNLSKKQILIFLGVLAIFVVLFFLLKDLFPSLNPVHNKSKNTMPIQKVRVGNVGVYTIFNLIAKDQAFFEKNGLNAEITEFGSGPESLAGLLAGKTDINVAADFVGVRNIFANPDIRILAQVNQHRIFQLAGRKDRISSPQDLKGKKIGVTENSAGEYFLGNFLTDNNLRLEDVTLVDLTPLEMIAQVEDGTIDAMVVFEPHVYNLQKKLGDNFISWDVQGEHNISAVVYTTQTFINKNPEIIDSYLRALVQAEDYYHNNVEETKEMVTQKFQYEKAYMDYSWSKLTHRITLNQELILGMEDQARWTIENKLTDKTTVPNYLEYIYFDGLSKVKPEAITIIH